MKCIVCGKNVKELHHSDNPQESCWSGGIVEQITAGYGSTYDCLSFLICVCDNCLTKKGRAMGPRLNQLLDEGWQFRFYRNALETITIEGTPNEDFIDRNKRGLTFGEEVLEQRFVSDGPTVKKAIKNLMGKLES